MRFLRLQGNIDNILRLLYNKNMNNLEYLNKLGYYIDTRTNNLANNTANFLLDTQNLDPIEVEVDDKIVVLKNDAYSMAFMEKVWSKLDLKQKLRVLNWTKTTFCEKYGLPNEPFMFFDDFDDSLEACPAYTWGNKIFLNLEDFFMKSTGYNCFEFLTHECMHVLQYNYYSEIPKSLCDYLPKYNSHAPNAKLEMETNILSLSLDGKNFNLRTQQYEYLSKRAKRDLVFFKNNIIIIPSTNENILCKKAKVKSYDDFENFMTNLMYYSSPFEYEAYITAKNLSSSLVKFNCKKHPDFVCDEDKMAVEKIRISKEKIIAKRHTLQKYFDMNADQIFDMQASYIYYKKLFENPFFQTESVKKRKQKFEDIYKSKFAPKFTSGLKEFLNNSLQTPIENERYFE